MNPTLVKHLDTLKKYTSYVSKGYNPENAYKLAFENNMIDTRSYRHALADIHEKIEGDLRSILCGMRVESIMATSLWDASFNIPYGCNKLVSIQKKADWLFEFTDSNHDLPVRYELGELSIDNQLILIDILQKV